MILSEQTQESKLESALLARAEQLAKEHIALAEGERERIIHEAREHTKLHQEREEQIASALAERHYRRRIQAAEIQLRTKLDQTRWALIQTVMSELENRLQELTKNENEYKAILKQSICAGAAVIESDTLTAYLNARDLIMFDERWQAFVQDCGIDKTITLSDDPIECSGGILLSTHDNRIRLDNTFEQRLQRLRPALEKTVMEKLFTGVTDPGIIGRG